MHVLLLTSLLINASDTATNDFEHEEKVLPAFESLSVTQLCNNETKTSNLKKFEYDNMLFESILDISNIAHQNITLDYLQELLATNYSSVKKIKFNKRMQFFVANFLIKKYSEHDNVTGNITIDINQQLKKFLKFTTIQKVCNLQEILGMINLHLKFLPEEKTFILYREHHLLCKNSSPFKSKNKEKLSFIIPWHVITYLRSLNSNDFTSICRKTIKKLLGYKDIILVCVCRDQSSTNNLGLPNFCDFLMKFCDTETLYSVQFELDTQSPMLNMDKYALYFPNVINYELNLNNIDISDDVDNEITIDIRQFPNLKKIKLHLETEVFDPYIAYVCVLETYSQITSLVYVNIAIDFDSSVINSLSDFTNLQKLSFENSTIAYKIYQVFSKHESICSFTLVDVLCMEFPLPNDEMICPTISMKNGRIVKIEIENDYEKTNISSLFNDFSLITHIKQLVLNEIVYCEGLLSKCLNIPKLESLHIYFKESNGYDIFIPDNYACYKTLTTLYLVCNSTEYEVKFDIRNIELCKNLKELNIGIDHDSKLLVSKFPCNSVILQNLATMLLSFDESHFNQLFGDLQNQKFTIDLLHITILNADYGFYQQLLDNSYLKENLRYLSFLARVPDCGTFKINLKGFKNLKILDFDVDKRFANDLIKHCIQERLIYNLKEVIIKDGFLLNYDFLNFITEIKELKINLESSLTSMAGSVFKNLDEFFIFNTVQVLTITYTSDKHSMHNEIAIITKMFPELKRFIYQIQEQKWETVHI